MTRVYLAGPINGCSDFECSTWRDVARGALGERVYDPTLWDFRGRESENCAAIVETDKAAIDASDVLLVNPWKPSAGTSMEILYAWERGKRVIVIYRDEPSPWIRYHAHEIYKTLAEALEALR